MNLFIKSYRVLLFFFALIACETSFHRGIAQTCSLRSSPYIQGVELPPFFNEIPNETFHTTGDGVLFLGKSNGLSIHSKEGSYHLYMEGPVLVSGEMKDSLAYASVNDLGFLVRDLKGKWKAHSMQHRIPDSYRHFTPGQLLIHHGMVFMNGSTGLLLIKDGQISPVRVEGDIQSLHLLKGSLYLRLADQSFLEWKETGPVPALHSVLNALPGNGELFLDYLPGGEKLLASEDDELILKDSQDRELFRLGAQEAFSAATLKQFKADKASIWILQSHSLSRIMNPVRLRTMEIPDACPGELHVCCSVADSLYLAIGENLYLAVPDLVPGNYLMQKLIKESMSPFRLIDHSSSIVFAGSEELLLALRKGEPEIISEGSVTGLMALGPDDVLAGLPTGIVRFRYREGLWQGRPLETILPGAHNFKLFGDMVCFISGPKVYAYGLETERISEIMVPEDQHVRRLSIGENGLYAHNGRSVFLYDPGNQSLLDAPDTPEARIQRVSSFALSEGNGEYWMLHDHLGDKADVIHVRTHEGEGIPRHYPVLGNFGEIVHMELSGHTLFLVTRDNVLLLDTREIPSVDLTLLKIDSIKNGQQGMAKAFISGLDFQREPGPVFRYRLLPGDSVWSDWSDSRNPTFTRLKPGNYSLAAQGMDLMGKVTESPEFSFRIVTPFHLRWYALCTYGIILIIILFLIRKLNMLRYRKAESRVSRRMQTRLDVLTREKEKSDRMVAEILPEKTAEQIREQGKAKWDKYERATVLFSDIQGFTKIAEEMNPEALIDELDQFFFHFDSVVDKYNIEKIKTIGDAYMAAGGIPRKNSTNPVEVVLAALEMQAYMQHLKSRKADIWDLRIGIHTGPVIAGVVGHKKMSYDIWGDTVNTASRMESSGEPGKVNISGITYGMVKEYFICEYRGKLPVKYKGNIDMYFVNGLRPELSVDLKGIPNKRFYTKLQLLRMGDLEEKVFSDILAGLDDNMRFHHTAYAKKVYDHSFLICRAEEIEQEERLITRTAALMLFTGLTQSYNNHENRSAVLAREILPDFAYSEPQIDQICNLILATKLPHQPVNRLEKILIDARMEYLGRPDYSERIKDLLKELQEHGSKLNAQQFKKNQLELLYNFEFFTTAARRLREVSGEDQMAILEGERWI